MPLGKRLNCPSAPAFGEKHAFSSIFKGVLIKYCSPKNLLGSEHVRAPISIGRCSVKAFAVPLQSYSQTPMVRMLGGKLTLFCRFDRQLEMPGNRATVHQGQIFRGGGREMSFAPSLRFLTDLGTDEVQTALAGGVTDRPFSRWYANGLADWIEGRNKILSGLDHD